MPISTASVFKKPLRKIMAAIVAASVKTAVKNAESEYSPSTLIAESMAEGIKVRPIEIITGPITTG